MHEIISRIILFKDKQIGKGGEAAKWPILSVLLGYACPQMRLMSKRYDLLRSRV